MKLAWTITTLLLLSLLPLAAIASPTKATNARQLEEIINTYNDGLTNKDVKKVLELYSSDPVFMPEYAPAAVGRDAIRKSYEWVFNTLKLNGIFHIDEVNVIGEYAWVRTHSTGKFTVIATGVEANVANTEFFLFKKEKGAWKIHRYIFTANTAPSSSK